MKRLTIAIFLALAVAISANAQQLKILNSSVVKSVVDSVTIRNAKADTSEAWPLGMYKYFSYQYRVRTDSVASSVSFYIQTTLNDARPDQWRTIDSVLAVTDTTWSAIKTLHIAPCKSVRVIAVGESANKKAVCWMDIFGGS